MLPFVQLPSPSDCTAIDRVGEELVKRPFAWNPTLCCAQAMVRHPLRELGKRHLSAGIGLRDCFTPRVTTFGSNLCGFTLTAPEVEAPPARRSTFPRCQRSAPAFFPTRAVGLTGRSTTLRSSSFSHCSHADGAVRSDVKVCAIYELVESSRI